MRGLIGWWLLNEGAGEQAYDSSLNRNTGTLTGMAFPPTQTSGWGSGRNGAKGLSFDGIAGADSDRINITTLNHNIGTGDFTWSAWVYPGRVTTNYDGIMSVGLFAPNMTVKVGPGSSEWGAYWGISCGSGNILALNRWYHLVFQRSGPTLRFYQDGVQTPTTHTRELSMANTSFNIGNNGNGTVSRLLGMIDDVRFYNRALSAQEVQNLYTDPYGMFNGSKLVLSDLIGAPAVANGGFFQFM